MESPSILTMHYNDVLFEGRNKAYGAYMIRRDYAKHMAVGLFSSVLFFICLIGLPLLGFHTPAEKTDSPGGTVVILGGLPLPVEPAPPVSAPSLPRSSFTHASGDLPPVIRRDPEVLPHDEPLPDQPGTENGNPGHSDQPGDPNGIPGFTGVSGNNTGGNPGAQIIEDTDDSIHLGNVSKPASFPGGIQAFLEFMKTNIDYPGMAKIAGIQGKVFLSFVVNKDGSITDVRITRDIGGGCGEEAVRVLKKSKWNPAEQQGKPVRYRTQAQVNFILDY